MTKKTPKRRVVRKDGVYLWDGAQYVREEAVVSRALQAVASGMEKPHMLDLPAYVRGADAPDEMRAVRESDDFNFQLCRHIERVIEMGKDAHDALGVDSAYSDEDAMHSLHDACSSAYKAIAILRRRSSR